ncbi:hypothetical protein HK097_006058 [Rhizophlyctis rosea]|uniref:Uncharacterized protein n=1 Tax=Rhizophlyctis rosea TaxID=64517 RepID=A0AAD5SED5_9FUNG|nr:hypothetical protein HK097_006058 [Rhizophlyctis rosea]
MLGEDEYMGNIHDVFVAIVSEAIGNDGYEGEFWLRQQAQPMYRMVQRYEEERGEPVCGEDWKVDQDWMDDKMWEILDPQGDGPLEGFWDNLWDNLKECAPNTNVSREAAMAALDYFYEKVDSFEGDFLARIRKRNAARRILRCKKRMFPRAGDLHHHLNRPDGPIARREASKYPVE